MTQQTILIVDDSQYIQRVLRLTLEREGYQVMVASSGEQALPMARQDPPDLILLDVLMPGGMDGFDTCEQFVLEESIADVPIFFLTVEDKPSQRARALKLGAVDYLTKPYQTQDLLDRIKRHLNTARKHSSGLRQLAGLQEETACVQNIQEKLLPQQMPSIPGLEVFGKTQPIPEVGGDYFDLLQQQDDLLACIGDVSGQGVPTTLVMTMTRTYMHQENIFPLGCDRIIDGINRTLVEGTEPEMYMTLVLLKWQAQAERLTFCGGGHLPMLVWRKESGQLEQIETGGHKLGIDAALPELTEQSLALAPGDLLLLHTDGLTNARNKQAQAYGPQRLAETIAGQGEKSAEALVTAVISDLQQFVGRSPQQDDITLLCLKRS